MQLVDVIPIVYLPRGVEQTFTYELPVNFAFLAGRFSLVSIPFRRRTVLGLITKSYSSSTPPAWPLKQVRNVLPYPRLTLEQQHIARLLQNIYGATATLAYKTILPHLSLSAVKGQLPTHVSAEALSVRTATDQLAKSSPYALPPAVLSQLSQSSYGAVLCNRVYDPRDAVFVKYIRQHSQPAPAQILVLLPDAQSLTFAFTYYQKALGVASAIWHSGLRQTQQMHTWMSIAEGKSQVILATRSGCFLPFRQLRAIVLFDESNDSYKSWNQQPYYDTRTLARALAATFHIPLLSTRALINPAADRQRPVFTVAGPLPQARLLIHNRKNLDPRERGEVVSPSLLETFPKNQSGPILAFTHRLGYAALTCRDCEYTAHCQRCAGLLTYQTSPRSPQAPTLYCYRCRLTAEAPVSCLQCQGLNLRFFGVGTEQLYETLQKKLPGARLIRMDANTMSTATALAGALVQISKAQVDVVVASPLILSRLWMLPRFAQVIVHRADSLFLVPDWRAEERALGALIQLRNAAQELCLIETAMPYHPVMQALAKGGSKHWLSNELKERKRFGYPPYRRLIYIATGNTGTQTSESEQSFRRFLQGIPSAMVTESVVANQKYLVLRVLPTTKLNDFWSHLPNNWKVDVDPVSLT